MTKLIKDAPKLSAQLRESIEKLKQQVTQYQHQQKGALKKYLAELKTVASAVDDKQLSTAQKHMQIAKRHAKQLDQTHLSKHHAEHSRLEKSILDLKQWKRFSTDPVREQLIQSMQQLADDALMAADERAKTIKQLQSQWRALGYSEDQSLWETFQALATEAYKPCKAAFDEEKNQRAFNLEQRLVICKEVEGLIEKTQWHLYGLQSAR